MNNCYRIIVISLVNLSDVFTMFSLPESAMAVGLEPLTFDFGKISQVFYQCAITAGWVPAGQRHDIQHYVFQHYDTQHYGTQHYDTQHNVIQQENR